jgi:hypothetical protein
MGRRNFGAQAFANFALEQRLHFVRRAREQDHDSFAFFELSAEPLSGGRAVGIWQNCRAFQNVGLLHVVRCYFPAAIGEALFEFGDDFRITVQADTESFGNCFARKVVFCRA